MPRGAPNTLGTFIEAGQKLASIGKRAGGKGSGGGNTDQKIASAARQAYENSMDMAGTDGQRAILRELTVDDYEEVGHGIAEGSGSGDDLLGLVSHPEGVEEILTESGEILQSGVEDALHY